MNGYRFATWRSLLVGSTCGSRTPGNTDPLQPLMGKMPNCLTECDFVPAGGLMVTEWDEWKIVDGRM